MNAARHQQIKGIFLEALERGSGERVAFVTERCGEDLELQREVLALLEHHDDEPGSGEESRGAGDGAMKDAATRARIGPGDEQVPIEDRYAGGPGSRPAAKEARSSSRSRLRFDHGRFDPGAMVAGRYRIVQLIGRGGMGEVYRADDLKLGESVALKFLPVQLTRNRVWLERLLDEVRAARTVSHPNVCRVYDVGDSTLSKAGLGEGSKAAGEIGAGENGVGEPFISMEYVDGETLTQISARVGRLSARKAEQLAQQLCAGLGAIHDAGIVHRDLKPSNILVDERGQLKVTDFGLANPGEIKGFEAAAGTPGYVAPESLSGVEATVRSDVYQLGLLLYELFTGVPAYRSQEGRDLLKLQQTTDPPPPSSVAPEIKPGVERVIMQCLERDPASRPASARAVARVLPGGDALAAALEAGETPSPSVVAMAGQKGRLRPGVAFTLAGAFAALLIAVLWLGPKAGLLQMTPLEKSGDVLADRARSMLETLGYPILASEHEAWGFDLYEELLTEIETKDQSANRWERLKRERPTPVDFWYRRSPNPIGTLKATGIIEMNDPPMATPGMIEMRLTPRGTLREIAIVDKDTYWVQGSPLKDTPMPEGQLGPPPPPVNVVPLFAAAGLDITKFRAVLPERIPQVFAEYRGAWSGVYPESPDTPIRVEVASLKGRVVAFRIGELELPGAQIARQRPAEDWKVLSDLASQAIFVAAVIGSAVFAWRNVRAKRGDFAGANRAGLLVACATLMTFFLSADTLRSATQPLGNFPWMFCASLGAGGLVWLLYVGIEPHVRRIWPESIISWSRLIQGRWTDPLVGTSLLVGAVLGCFTLLCVYGNRLLPGALGVAPARPFVDERFGVVALMGVRESVGHLAACWLHALQVALVLLVAGVLLKLIVRKTVLAIAILGVAQTLVWVLGSPVLNTWSWSVFGASCLVIGTIVTLGLTLLVRYGVLALMAAGFVFTVLATTPIPLNTSAWNAGLGMLALCAAIAPAAYGAVVAMVGKSKA